MYGGCASPEAGSQGHLSSALGEFEASLGYVRHCSEKTNNIIWCVIFLLLTKHFIHCEKKRFSILRATRKLLLCELKGKKHRFHIADLFKISFKPYKPFIEANANITFHWLLLVYKKKKMA